MVKVFLNRATHSGVSTDDQRKYFFILRERSQHGNCSIPRRPFLKILWGGDEVDLKENQKFRKNEFRIFFGFCGCCLEVFGVDLSFKGYCRTYFVFFRILLPVRALVAFFVFLLQCALIFSSLRDSR